MDGWLQVVDIPTKLQEGRAEDPLFGVNVVAHVVKVNAVAEGCRPLQRAGTSGDRGLEKESCKVAAAGTGREERTCAPSHLCTAHVTVGDETGTIALVVTGRDRISLLDTLQKCGTAAVIRGASVRVFRGRAQLRLGLGSGSLRSYMFQCDGARSASDGLSPPQPRIAPASANTDPDSNVSAIRWVSARTKPKRRDSASQNDSVKA